MNTALSNAVDRAGSSVTFVDYAKYYKQAKGRYCEAGVKETSPNHYGLLFYEWDTKDSTQPTDGKKAQAALSSSSPARSMTRQLVMNGTFEAAISKYIQRTLEQHPSWNKSLAAAQGDTQSLDEVKATDDQIERGTSGGFLPDGYGKVFRPRPN